MGRLDESFRRYMAKHHPERLSALDRVFVLDDGKSPLDGDERMPWRVQELVPPGGTRKTQTVRGVKRTE